MEYNTTRSKLALREYGRNFHKLVDHLRTFKEKEKRNELSKALIEMMKITHPDLRDQNEVDAKLWDDLYIMSNYDLDIDSPFPKPIKKSIEAKPTRLPYPKNIIKYKHYGKTIEMLIEKASKLKDDQEKESAVVQIGKIMKSFFGMWNKESIDNSVIIEHIKELSDKKLTIDLNKVQELNLFHKVTKERGSNSYPRKNIRPKRPFRKRKM